MIFRPNPRQDRHVGVINIVPGAQIGFDPGQLSREIAGYC